MAGKVGLIGAAGAIGKTVAESLRAQGREYRVLGRKRAPLQAAFGDDPLAEIALWNPDDASSVRTAVRGTESLVYLVGVPYDQFHLHPVVMRQTLDGAIAEGVDRMLLVGTVYPYGIPQTNPVKEDHPRNPHTFKGKKRKEQEDLLLAADAAGKIKGTVLRVPDFYGPGVDRSFLDSLIQAAANGSTANLIGPLDSLHQFAYVPDVGPIVAKLLDTPGAYGKWWHFAGSGAITQRELIDKVAAITGCKPRTVVAGKTMLRLLGLFNPLMRELVEMNYLMTTPVLLDDSALRGLIGEVHTTPYEEGLRQSIEWARTHKTAK